MNHIKTEKPAVNFDNTAIGFGYKTNHELKKARLLFTAMKFPWLVKIGTRLTLLAMKWKLPVNPLIKNTLFKQFVGGENLSELTATLTTLKGNHVQAILDYGAEGNNDEIGFDTACAEFLNLIHYAAQNRNVPFISIKITALARFELLETINKHVYDMESGLSINLEHLTPVEAKEWQEVERKVDLIASRAATHQIGVLVDAEESWIQDAINVLTEKMMRKYNTERAVVYNTIQFYCTGSYRFLLDSMYYAEKGGYKLGVKIVRGAYMEKERLRAARLNYPSPIQADKRATDEDFNKGLAYCLRNISTVSTVIATHNEQSNQIAVKLLYDLNIPAAHPHVHFSQLFGMSDNITFNLAKDGYSVSKYLPYGSIGEVIPYLMRRAQENTSVSGQTGRELFLIRRELKRRMI